METMSHQATAVQHAPFSIDDEGFLLDPDQWSEDLAGIFAESAGVGNLSKPHWDVIYFIRERYLGHGSIPPMRLVCRKLGTERAALKALFGGCLRLWRIAGLPNPGEEAKAYMD